MGGKMYLPPRRKDFTMYNYLIVGSGLYGAVIAQQLHAAGKKFWSLIRFKKSKNYSSKSLR